MGRGQLVFKGEEKAKKKKKKSKSKLTNKSEKAVASLPPGTAPTVSSSAQPEAPKIRQGTGMITSSGSVVTGHETRFLKQVHVGDAILVEMDGQQEMRVVTMCLSNTSLSLSSGFSENLKTPIAFSFIVKPRNVVKERQAAQQEAAESERDLQQHAFGTYGQKELVYRERTDHGSYRIQRVQAKGDVSRGDLLEMRAKKTSDKYC